MGRPPQVTEAAVSYHLLTRWVMRLMVFEKWLAGANRSMDGGALKAVRQSSTTARNEKTIQKDGLFVQL